jgi:flagellar motor switch/type III secretory pathway protein FliN
MRAIELRVLTALAPWGKSWLPEATQEPQLQVQALGGASQLQGRFTRYSNDVGSVWFRADDGDDAALATVLLGTTESRPGPKSVDPVLGRALAQARSARERAIAAVLIGAHADPAEAMPGSDLLLFGSGAVVLSSREIGLCAIADACCLRHVPPMESARSSQLSRLRPVETAIRRAKVELSVSLGEVELELRQMVDLQAGDVIRLPTRLHDELEVCIGEEPVAAARLGLREESRAVQLISVKDLGEHHVERRAGN